MQGGYVNIGGRKDYEDGDDDDYDDYDDKDGEYGLSDAGECEYWRWEGQWQ